MVFESHGLKNGIVTLPGFDRDVAIGELNYLRFDGVVQNIDEYTAKLCQEFRLQNNFGDGRELSGRTLTIRYHDFIGSIIFYKDLEETHNIFTLGHESTEALIDYGMEQMLASLIREAGFSVNGNLGGIPRECFCDIGGLLALHLQGKYEEFARQYPDRIDPYIRATIMPIRRQ